MWVCRKKNRKVNAVKYQSFLSELRKQNTHEIQILVLKLEHFPHTLLYYSNFEKKKHFLGDFFNGVVQLKWSLLQVDAV